MDFTTTLLRRSSEVQSLEIVLGESRLKWVSCVKHLGNYLECNLSEETEIRGKRRDWQDSYTLRNFQLNEG